MKAERESDIQAACLTWLKLHGSFCWRQNRTGVYDRKTGCYRPSRSVDGLADIIGIWRGNFLAVEVKRPGKKPTPEQEWFLETVRGNGGLAFCIHSVAELEAALLE